jgi:uncharacterized surface protein with fasciclin (FAS1) repeats
LLCKQGYECLEFADNAIVTPDILLYHIVDGAYTYNTITSLTKGEKRLLGNEVFLLLPGSDDDHHYCMF